MNPVVTSSLTEAYRKVRNNGHNPVPAEQALRAARANIEDAAMRARFDRIGALCYSTTEDARERDIERAYDDMGNVEPRVRLLLIPDYDGASNALDFDCCTSCDGDRIIDHTHAYGWRKCDHVTRRDPEDVTTISEHRQACEYGQPCKHKCDEARRCEREGVYGLVGQARDSHGQWHTADGCWGFVGDDWRGSGYDTDIMRAALDLLDNIEGC
jgi:hypothetical protein